MGRRGGDHGGAAGSNQRKRKGGAGGRRRRPDRWGHPVGEREEGRGLRGKKLGRCWSDRAEREVGIGER
jgi:hypothetical protein